MSYILAGGLQRGGGRFTARGIVLMGGLQRGAGGLRRGDVRSGRFTARQREVHGAYIA